jgi:hypothetical protein
MLQQEKLIGLPQEISQDVYIIPPLKMLVT